MKHFLAVVTLLTVAFSASADVVKSCRADLIALDPEENEKPEAMVYEVVKTSRGDLRGTIAAENEPVDRELDVSFDEYPVRKGITARTIEDETQVDTLNGAESFVARILYMQGMRNKPAHLNVKFGFDLRKVRKAKLWMFGENGFFGIMEVSDGKGKVLGTILASVGVSVPCKK